MKQKIGKKKSNLASTRPLTKNGGHQRDKSKTKILKMYNEKPDMEKMSEKPLLPVRIQPDRRWFGNTRVITQSRLSEFRKVLEEKRNNSYNVLLKKTILPTSLFLPESTLAEKKPESTTILAFEPFEKTFGKKQLRKRPKLSVQSFSEAINTAETVTADYNREQDPSASVDFFQEKDAKSEEVFKKGTSRRIWQELYKVIDSSDVVVEVLDARDPFGSRCYKVEQHIKKNCPNKHIVLLLNKCDLVPSWCATRWLKILSSDFPTIAFHSSITNSFGKISLINLLRQYSSLLKHCKHVSVGFIGYPNVGKSSVINTLKSKKVCKAAPIPGETKIWQYVSLTHRIHLIDCPGIVLVENAEDDTTKVLKGVVRAEKIECPSEHIGELLNRVDKSTLSQKYKLTGDWNNSEEFLMLLAQRLHKLQKGGELDIETTARIVLYDWQRGRIPYFVAPPAPLEVQQSQEKNNKEVVAVETEPVPRLENTINSTD